MAPSYEFSLRAKYTKVTVHFLRYPKRRSPRCRNLGVHRAQSFIEIVGRRGNAMLKRVEPQAFELMTLHAVGHVLDAMKIPIITKRALGIIGYATIRIIELFNYQM